MVSLFMCVPMCVCVVCECDIVSSVCFIVPCGKGSGLLDVVVDRLAVTPFPPDSFPVPSTAAVVQPVSDLCCAHTDTDTEKYALKLARQDCTCTLTCMK